MIRMNSSADLTRYLIWAGVVVGGALLGVVDRRWIRLPVLGALLAAGVIGGLMVTKISPFTFGSGDYYMEGVILSGGSALALVGYVLAMIGYILAAVWQFARRRFGGASRETRQ
jgi:hypothetical protein